MNNNLIFDLVRATEQTALCAMKHLGKDDKLALDIDTANVMRSELNKINFSAVIAYGEGKKDQVPHLENGEKIGFLNTSSPNFSIVVDPIDGSGVISRGNAGATSVLAIGNLDAFPQTDLYYMYKLACNGELAKKADIHITDKPDSIIYKLAHAKKVNPEKICVCTLDRNRHSALISAVRTTKCKLVKIMDCDIDPCIQAAMGEIDVFIGSGGVAEGFLSSSAIKVLDGFFQFQFVDNKNFSPVDDKIFNTSDINGNICFISTGATNNSLTKGIRYVDNHPVTSTIIMDSETRRIMNLETSHLNYNW